MIKYDIYIVEDGYKKLMKKNVDGETVRKFMARLNYKQRENVELERFYDYDYYEEEDYER